MQAARRNLLTATVLGACLTMPWFSGAAAARTMVDPSQGTHSQIQRSSSAVAHQSALYRELSRVVHMPCGTFVTTSP